MEEPTPVEEARAEFVPAQISFSDFQSWLITRIARGVPEGHLLKLAMVSINRHFDAATRWARLESQPAASAPLWLNKHEAEKLAKILSANRGADVRLIRQAILDLFAPE
jgi:hypothetical protein